MVTMPYVHFELEAVRSRKPLGFPRLDEGRVYPSGPAGKYSCAGLFASAGALQPAPYARQAADVKPQYGLHLERDDALTASEASVIFLYSDCDISGRRRVKATIAHSSSWLCVGPNAGIPVIFMPFFMIQ